MRLRLMLVSIVGLGLLAACGGSDSDRDGLEGTYFYTAFFGAYETGAGIAQWGFVEADGQSLLTEGRATQNIVGSVVGPAPLFLGTVPFEIGDGCRLEWGRGDSPLGPVAFGAGGIRWDKRLAVMTNVQEDSLPGLMLIGKQESRTFSLRSIRERYHLGVLYRNTDLQDGSIWGKVTFDGDGTGSSETYVNFRGNPGGPFEFEDTYSVQSDGIVTWDYGSTLGTFYGGIVAGGDVLLLAGKDGGDGAPAIAVMVRESYDASNATLDGEYHVVTMHALLDEDEIEWVTATGDATADGDGTLELEGFRVNADGMIDESPEGGAAGYEVLPDGTLIVSEPFACRGGVSRDGQFAVFSGGTEEEVNPQIWILLRK